MKGLRAGWLSFRRIHLAALIADWRRTLLSVIGVALGVSVVLGTWILKSELARPFDSFGPSLTHAADIGVVEVTPNVSGRLPIETVNRLRAEVTGAEAVIPIVAALTPHDFSCGAWRLFRWPAFRQVIAEGRMMGEASTSVASDGISVDRPSPTSQSDPLAVLSHIRDPYDLQVLSRDELTRLADEMRVKSRDVVYEVVV